MTAWVDGCLRCVKFSFAPYQNVRLFCPGFVFPHTYVHMLVVLVLLVTVVVAAAVLFLMLFSH